MCKKLPKEYVVVTADKLKAMSPAQIREMRHKNFQLLKPYLPQSVSLHKPVSGSAKLHDNLVPIYNPNAGNNGEDPEFWGAMLLADMDKVKYVFTTEHQLIKGVYYRGNDTKVYLLPPKEEWTAFGNGNISIMRIARDKVKHLSAVPSLQVVAPQTGHARVCLYVGLNPKTTLREFTATCYSWDGKATSDVIHSASTENYCCGSFLYDSTLNAVVGLHHGSIGPDSKHGENNLCSPLKAMEARQ